MNNAADTTDIMTAISEVAAHSPVGCARLADVRNYLGWSKEVFEADVLAANNKGLIVLFPDDDRASLTKADHESAVTLAVTPMHLAYLA